MKIELQEKLFKKYPKIFKQKDLDMTQTCMCWGIECGNGWYWLIDKLCEFIQNYVDNNNLSQVEATQVKEKFGGLNFYVSSAIDDIFGAIQFANKLSYVICEECGSFKGKSAYAGNWIKTICPKCISKEKYEIYSYEDEKTN